MSAAQLEAQVKTLNLEEIFSLESILRREKVRRMGEAQAQENELLEIINQPMPQTERYRALEPAWEAGTLTEAERSELLKIVEAREELDAERLQAVRRLAELRGESFDALWRQIMGPTPQPRLVLG